MAGRRGVGSDQGKGGVQESQGASSSARRKKVAPSDARAATLPMLRTSERSTLKTCEWRWDLEFNQLRKPHVSMPALRFGTLVHKALADYYVPGIKRGEHPAIAFERHYAEEIKINAERFGAKVKDIEGDEKWVSALELGVGMMNNYVDEYGADDRYEVIVTEVPFETIVYWPPRTKLQRDYPQPWFQYVGVMDGVWRRRSDKTLWIPDHKTTAGIGDSKLNYLVMDDQAGSYWSFGVDWLVKQELLGKNPKIAGMLYNFLRKALPDERPSRIINGKRMYLNKPTKANPQGDVSLKQPSPYFLRQPIFRGEYDREQVRQRAMADYAYIESLRDDHSTGLPMFPKQPIRKNPGMFTCPSCWARDACELHETGADWVSFVKETTREWDPYAEHEVYGGR